MAAEARLAGRIGDYTIPVYHRELERYGGPRSFPSYERLFCRETAHIVAMLPIIDPDPPTPATSAALIRPGVEAAAGVLTQWLDGLDPSRVNTGEVIDVSVDNYSREFGAAVHKIKTVLRQQHPQIDADNGLVPALREFWADPAQRDAVMTPTVLQSASHLGQGWKLPLAPAQLLVDRTHDRCDDRARCVSAGHRHGFGRDPGDDAHLVALQRIERHFGGVLR